MANFLLKLEWQIIVPNFRREAFLNRGVRCIRLWLRIDVKGLHHVKLSRRYYYTTPTSFLELIQTFKQLLAEKRDYISTLKNKYEACIETCLANGSYGFTSV